MGLNQSKNDIESSAWNNFLSAHHRVVTRVDADLTAECRITFAEYDVLAHLAAAPEHQLRMNELAERARLSPSGLTRRFDALARRGWVTREPCDDDRRGVVAQLTDEGLAVQRNAQEVHLRGTRDHFLARFEPEEIALLDSMLTRIALVDPDGGGSDGSPAEASS